MIDEDMDRRPFGCPYCGHRNSGLEAAEYSGRCVECGARLFTDSEYTSSGWLIYETVWAVGLATSWST